MKDEGYLRVFYIHSVTKIVINMAELKSLDDNARVIVKKTLYDEFLNRKYDYVNSNNGHFNQKLGAKFCRISEVQTLV